MEQVLRPPCQLTQPNAARFWARHTWPSGFVCWVHLQEFIQVRTKLMQSFGSMFSIHYFWWEWWAEEWRGESSSRRVRACRVRLDEQRSRMGVTFRTNRQRRAVSSGDSPTSQSQPFNNRNATRCWWNTQSNWSYLPSNLVSLCVVLQSNREVSAFVEFSEACGIWRTFLECTCCPGATRLKHVRNSLLKKFTCK